VKVEGTGYLDIGTIKSKSGDAVFDNEQIFLTEDEKTTYVEKLSTVSINRTTGFIKIFVVTSYPRRKLPDMTEVSGFCLKASNKKKF
jgi:hypothetical protein